VDGKALALELRRRLAGEVSDFAARYGRPPGLDVVLVGEDPASLVYTRNKEQAASKLGFRGRLHRLPAETTESALLGVVGELNADPTVDGLLVQLPLPAGLDPQRITDQIDPDKDVDGLHPVNAGRLITGRPGLVACTPRGIMKILAHTGTALRGARAVVVGRSNIVGKPIAQLLLREHATVTMAHSRTRELAALCREAELLVVAVGRAGLVRGDWIRPGAVVIDVGSNRTDDGKLVGDVVADEAADQASWLTPVPGGVGPMTIACLLENTLLAARSRVGRGEP
jgi:methylenetetrahydrofolate dehydrogenase (NADP+)/methenyltetrahydrofolate cyclohydrolase